MDIGPILASLKRHKLTVALIVTEIALTCFIAVNGSWFIGQLIHRMNVSSGVADHALVVIRTTAATLKPSGNQARMQADLAALTGLAGVKAASVVNQVPFGGSQTADGIRLSKTQNRATLGAATYRGKNLIHTFGLHLVAGRDFQPGEYIGADAFRHGKEQPGTAIITRTLAQRLWPGQNALGQTFYIGHPVRVVGVVAGLIRPASLGGPNAQWSIMLPVRASATDTHYYVLRTTPGQREHVLRAAVSKLKSLDPRRIFQQKDTLDQARTHMAHGLRSTAGSLIGVIVLLMLVTALGIVGLASFWVAQRRHTIGVRRALGATRGDILRYFQLENLLIVGAGIGLGMVSAYGFNLVLMVHAPVPRMPLWFALVGALVLWLLGQLAVLGPALRAARVPPVVATRSV